MYDTKTDAESLENHASRAEVSQALSTGTGESTRYSSTLMEKTMYYAQRLDDGTVLRISISRATVGMIAVGMVQPLLIVLIVALILSGMLARRLSRRIVDPLNSLDLEHPLDNDAYEELSPLLKRIHHQHVEIRTQLRELREKTDEFTQITGSMREGLVLLDEHGSILSINAAAQALFGADAGSLGTVLVDVLGTLGAVHQKKHEGGRHFSDAVADQNLAGLAVHSELEHPHVDSHQHRAVAGLNTVDAVLHGQHHALAAALIELTAGSRDVEDEAVHQASPPFSSASLSAAFLRASSRVPTLKKAHSGRSSHLPSTMAAKPLTVSASGTYLPGRPVKFSATEKGWDRNFCSLRARVTVSLSSSPSSSMPRMAMMSCSS